MRQRSIPEEWNDAKASGSQQSVPPGSGENQVPQKQKRRGWLSRWVFWAVLAVVISGGVGVSAVALLLKLPTVPNCPSIFWPLASASMRLYCAQVAANKQTVNDLLQAMALVKVLPANHPLHPEINSFMEQWSLDLLELGNEAFQAGKLEEAIAIAHKVPKKFAAKQGVEERIESWQSTWSDAEGIYKDGEAEIRLYHWGQASRAAVRLLNVNNKYWATTKYDELNNRIETTRQDSNKLAKAQNLGKRGGLDNLLEALKLTESIDTNSYIYQEVQQTNQKFGRKLLDLAQASLDEKDADEAIAIANQIPASTNLQPEAQDLINLAQAWRSAWMGTGASLRSAIEIAKNIGADRPLYNKAQELTSRWTLEIQDVAHLERARGLAKGGTVNELNAAIAEAELIPDNNPRASERDQEIARWHGQVETIEDQPYLDKAEQIANASDINSLQAAINEASQIGSGRALYKKAQSKIRGWTSKIEQIQDQPYLDKAEQIANGSDINSLQAAINQASQIGSGRSLYQEAQSKIKGWTSKIEQIQDQPYLEQARYLASSGDLLDAIAAAQHIQPGRALSDEAQAAINDWQRQIRSKEDWQEARQIALQATPEALREAIRVADRVPTNSPLRTDVDNAINQWSHEMLSIAQSHGGYDLSGAIAIAKQIPPGTDAYKAAQEQIQLWQKLLNPNPNPNPNPNLNSGFNQTNLQPWRIERPQPSNQRF